MATAKKLTPKGIRNNNPGNIEHNLAIKWQGATGTDGRFVTFKDPASGLRALARNLLTYQEQHGLNTVAGIINRWAPPKENNTTKYIESVANVMGIRPDEAFEFKGELAILLMRAIIAVENGFQPYTVAQLRAALTAAGVESEPKPLKESRTVQGTTVAIGATAIGFFAEHSDLITGVAGILLPGHMGTITKVAALLGAAYALYARWDDYKNGVK